MSGTGDVPDPMDAARNVVGRAAEDHARGFTKAGDVRCKCGLLIESQMQHVEHHADAILAALDRAGYAVAARRRIVEAEAQREAAIAAVRHLKDSGHDVKDGRRRGCHQCVQITTMLVVGVSDERTTAQEAARRGLIRDDAPQDCDRCGATGEVNIGGIVHTCDKCNGTGSATGLAEYLAARREARVSNERTTPASLVRNQDGMPWVPPVSSGGVIERTTPDE